MTKRSFRIDFNNNTIVLTKAFAQKAANPTTEEFKELMSLRKNLEGFTVVVKESARKANKKNSLKGLNYGFMEQYIARHDDEKNSTMVEFKKITVKNGDALSTKSYGEVKKWFLEQYPEFNEVA